MIAPANDTAPSSAKRGAWWGTRKEPPVIGTAALLVLAYAVSRVEWAWSFWA
jgi:hypothetical protein